MTKLLREAPDLDLAGRCALRGRGKCEDPENEKRAETDETYGSALSLQTTKRSEAPSRRSSTFARSSSSTARPEGFPPSYGRTR